MLSIPGPHSGNLEYNQQKFCVACPEQLLKQCLQETTMIAVIIHCFVKKSTYIFVKQSNISQF